MGHGPFLLPLPEDRSAHKQNQRTFYSIRPQVAADCRERAQVFEQVLAAGAFGAAAGNGGDLLAALKPRYVLLQACLSVYPVPCIIMRLSTFLTSTPHHPTPTNKQQPARRPPGHAAPARLPRHPPQTCPPPPPPPTTRGSLPLRRPPAPAAGAKGAAAAERGGEQPGAARLLHEPRLPRGVTGAWFCGCVGCLDGWKRMI